ncbi:MAG: hypothetical protein DDT19_01129 [Syntrophomonadaceae bacterium]|nr:hypothetical protein [Bacillota bacterium]
MRFIGDKAQKPRRRSGVNSDSGRNMFGISAAGGGYCPAGCGRGNERYIYRSYTTNETLTPGIYIIGVLGCDSSHHIYIRRVVEVVAEIDSYCKC